MARKNRQTQTTKQNNPEHVKSWTGPKPPAKVRPTTPVVEPDTKPSQPEVKPQTEVKPDPPKSEN